MDFVNISPPNGLISKIHSSINNNSSNPKYNNHSIIVFLAQFGLNISTNLITSIAQNRLSKRFKRDRKKRQKKETEKRDRKKRQKKETEKRDTRKRR